jgi:hypothetical protein
VEFNRRFLARVVPAAAAIIGTVVALGFVVVASARRAPKSQTGSGVPGLVKNLGAAAVVVYLVVGVYLVVMAFFRGQRQRPVRSLSRPMPGVIAFVLFVVLVSFSVTKLRRGAFGALPGLFPPSSPPQQTQSAPTVAEEPITWGYLLGFGLVATLVLLLLASSVRKLRSRVLPPPQVDKRTLVGTSLDDVLMELENEVDPRRAVLLADHGMEMALAQHGLPRSVNETAQEHLQRVTEELSLTRTAAQTLMTLYGMAHFSETEISVSDRSSAIAALRSVRNELREKPPLQSDFR